MARRRSSDSPKTRSETDRAVSQALREGRVRELDITRPKTPILDSFEELAAQLKRSAGR